MPLYAYNTLNPGLANRITGVVGEPVFKDQLVASLDSFVDFKLTAAQMDTLNATPVTVLAAPGVGLTNWISRVEIVVVPGATAFELGSGTLDFKYTDGSGASVCATIPNATLETASGTNAFYSAIAVSVATLENAVIVAKTTTDVTAGDGAVYGRIYYKTINTAGLIS